jgi:hypothetical protein
MYAVDDVTCYVDSSCVVGGVRLPVTTFNFLLAPLSVVVFDSVWYLRKL